MQCNMRRGDGAPILASLEKCANPVSSPRLHTWVHTSTTRTLPCVSKRSRSSSPCRMRPCASRRCTAPPWSAWGCCLSAARAGRVQAACRPKSVCFACVHCNAQREDTEIIPRIESTCGVADARQIWRRDMEGAQPREVSRRKSATESAREINREPGDQLQPYSAAQAVDGHRYAARLRAARRWPSCSMVASRREANWAPSEHYGKSTFTEQLLRPFPACAPSQQVSAQTDAAGQSERDTSCHCLEVVTPSPCGHDGQNPFG